MLRLSVLMRGITMSDFGTHRVRGCEPRSWVRESRAPQGRIVANRKVIIDANGVEYRGIRGKALVTIKTGSGRLWRQFVRFCRHNGLEFHVPEKAAPVAERWIDTETGEWVPDEEPQRRDYQTVYEVIGGPALDTLQSLPCVVGMTYVLHVGAPHFNSSTYRR